MNITSTPKNPALV